MKRFAILLAAMLLCLSTLGACAELSLTEVYTFDEHVVMISDTNVLYKQIGEGYALFDLNGSQLTEPEFYYDFTQEHGRLKVTKISDDTMTSRGMLNADGTVAVPFQYSEVENPNEFWALGVVLEVATGEEYDYFGFNGNDNYNIVTVDVYSMPEGKLVATLDRDQYVKAYACGPYINIIDRQDHVRSYDAAFNLVQDGGYSYSFDYIPGAIESFTGGEDYKYGLRTVADESVLIEPHFEYLSVDEETQTLGMMVFGDEDDKEGLVDLQGNVIVPAEYDRINKAFYHAYDASEIDAYVVGGYICVEKDEKLGYVDLSGKETCPAKYSEDDASVYGMSMLVGDKLVAADGVETDLNGYDSVYALTTSGGMYYKVSGEEYGVIDWHGELVVPMEYDSISLSGDGQHLLLAKDGAYTVAKIG